MNDARIDLAPDHSVDLSDGRKLAYIEVGDPDGYPVLSNHGGLSSRFDVFPSGPSALAHGLRVISPDRPGIGMSDVQDGRTIADWPADVRELTAQLGIGEFATIGWSSGGCYAQSVGRTLGDRVSVMVLVASAIPRDWASMRDDINRMDRFFMKLSEHRAGQVVERSIFHVMGNITRSRPQAFLRNTGLGGISADAFVAAISNGLSDTKGVVADYQMLNTPWGFDPSEITVPTQIWQGDADDLVPADWAPRLHEAIHNSTLTVVPGANHFLWYDHWDDIFAGIAGVVA